MKPIVALLAVLLTPMLVKAQSSVFCTDYGSGIFCDNGLSAQRFNNMMFFSDGSSAMNLGNQVYFSNGVSGQTFGNTTYFSNGDVATRNGNTVTLTTSPQYATYRYYRSRSEYQREEAVQRQDDAYSAGYALGYASGELIAGLIARHRRIAVEHHCELDPYWSRVCGQKFDPADKGKLEAGAWLANWNEIHAYLPASSDDDRGAIINWLYNHPSNYRGNSSKEKARMYHELDKRLEYQKAHAPKHRNAQPHNSMACSNVVPDPAACRKPIR